MQAKKRIYRWIPVLLWMSLIFFLSAQPDLPGIPGLDLIDWNDKVKHFITYAILGALIWRALGRKRAKWWQIVIPAIIAAIYGASDELHQKFVPGRSCDPLDWAADTFGAFTAAVILAIWPRK